MAHPISLYNPLPAGQQPATEAMGLPREGPNPCMASLPPAERQHSYAMPSPSSRGLKRSDLSRMGEPPCLCPEPEDASGKPFSRTLSMQLTFLLPPSPKRCTTLAYHRHFPHSQSATMAFRRQAPHPQSRGGATTCRRHAPPPQSRSGATAFQSHTPHPQNRGGATAFQSHAPHPQSRGGSMAFQSHAPLHQSLEVSAAHPGRPMSLHP